jgi:acetylglutamate kinase
MSRLGHKLLSQYVATVHLTRDGDATVFHVHGGGLVISRMINEFGIARKAVTAIAEAFAGRS